MAIIQSLLDTDFYKLTMAQVAFHQYATTEVVYTFKCRNKADWTQEMVQEIREELGEYASLRLSHQEYDYLRGLRFFKSSFLNFLRLYQPRSGTDQSRASGRGIGYRGPGPLVYDHFF
jgi:nicotinate phosphoribosyltransferase